MSAAPVKLDNKTNTGLIRGLVAVLVVLVAGYLYASIEVFDKTTSKGFAAEARNQPYLAAQKVLQSYQLQVSLYDDFRGLFAETTPGVIPAENDAVILTEGEIPISQQRAAQILSWVESGGHLILSHSGVSQDGIFRSNHIMQQLDIRVEWLESDEPFAEYQAQQPTDMVNPNDLPLSVNLETSYRIILPPDRELTYQAGDDEGMTFAQMDYGNGLITLMTETYIWNNYQIDEADNVELLVNLLDWADHIHIFSARELPHWTTLLYDYAPYFIWFASLTIVLIMWRLSVRFGPVQHQDEHSYSPFSMHIKAAGEFYWRSGQQADLLKDLRVSVLTELSRRVPKLKNADRKQQLERLAQLSGWSGDSIEELLFSDKPLNEMQFTQWIQGLQKLRKMI